MKIKLPKCALLALIAFQAKKDIRYYLNGICLYPNGEAAATDGHRMIYITGLEPWGSNGDENVIISFDQKVPGGKWEYVIIDTEVCMAEYITSESHVAAFSMVSVADGRFPDVQRVIPKGEPEPASSIGFNAKYINAAAKTARLFSPRFESIRFDLYGNTNAAVATVKSLDGITAKIIVMPMRID